MAGPAPTAFGVMDQPAGWVVCFDCQGERLVTDCLSGAACPHEPPCPTRRCRTCGGDGGWPRQPAEAAP